MKLIYDKNSFEFSHRFTFILDDFEVSVPLSDRAYPSDTLVSLMCNPHGIHEKNRIGLALGIINETYLKDNKEKDIGLGLNYKEKYKEIEALLEPYKIDNMDPVETLKMLLKYNLKDLE